MKTIQTDILGVTPEVNDIIAFNPPKYKGLVYGTCIGFTDAGLPKLVIDKTNFYNYAVNRSIEEKGWYSPKTSFVCVKK